MQIKDMLVSRNCNTGSDGSIARRILQETEPYTVSKNILGLNIYIWNLDFIDRVIESFSTNVVMDFSKKEKDLFDRYTHFLIHGIVDVLDEDVRGLDMYIGSIRG